MQTTFIQIVLLLSVNVSNITAQRKQECLYQAVRTAVMSTSSFPTKVPRCRKRVQIAAALHAHWHDG
jgi:hypothetical protein